MKKKIQWLFFILLMIACFPVPVKALEPELEDALDTVLKDYDLNQWQSSYASLPSQIRQLWGY